LFNFISISDHSVNISFAYGCKISDSDQSGFSVAIELAQSSDIVIFFGHIDQSMESEEHDQISIRLSDVQSYLIKQL
jgi:hypothetical protein